MRHAAETPSVVEPKDVALRMRMDYSHGIKEHATRNVEDISALCARVKQSGFELDSFLKDVADLVSRQFGIANVSVAVWDRAHDSYKYRVVIGFEKEAAEAYKSITYTKTQLMDEKTYPSHEISKCTRLYLSEEHPYTEGEESSFARPGLLGMKRRSVTDSLEGDYLCFFISGADDEILGWIEASGTRLRKLPDTATIKWIELLACIVGVVIRLRG